MRQCFPVLRRRDAGFDLPVSHRFAEPVAIVAAVAKQLTCRRQHRKQECGALVIVHLAFRQHNHDRSALPVASRNLADWRRTSGMTAETSSVEASRGVGAAMSLASGADVFVKELRLALKACR
jgi:hypothetical protein